MNRKVKVLFIDDDLDFVETYRKTLPGAFQMDVATTIEDAVDKLNSADYEVAVVDLAFPKDRQAGLRVLQHVRQAGLRTRIVMLSGVGGLDDCLLAINEGMHAWVVKGRAETNEALFAAMFQAAREADVVHIKFDDSNRQTIRELRETLGLDDVGVIREGLKLLNWAVGEWRQGWQVKSELGGKARVYPALLRRKER